MSLENKIALVTGASRGIGRAIAQQLAHQGATVIGTATSEAGAEKISQYLKEQGNAGCGMALNVTDQANIDQVLAAMTERFEMPQILVNNAGITRDNLILRMKPEEWDAVIDTNLNSMYRMCKAVLRPMIKARWGRIINISSVVGVTGNGGQANYATAKAGVIGFSKSLAQEIASRSITVNVVAPGYIQTDMTGDLTDEQQQMILNIIPTRTAGQPEDIAYAVAFLASPQAAYITGETLHVNGGMYMA